MASATIAVEVRFTNPDVMLWLQDIAEVMGDLKEDFSYRGDVQEALQSAENLMKSVRLQPQMCDTDESGRS